MYDEVAACVCIFVPPELFGEGVVDVVILELA